MCVRVSCHLPIPHSPPAESVKDWHTSLGGEKGEDNEGEGVEDHMLRQGRARQARQAREGKAERDEGRGRKA